MSEVQEPGTSRKLKPNRFRITSIVIAAVMLMGAFGVFIGPFTINVSAAPDTHTWDGGGADAFAGTHANWVTDIAPEAGDSVIFDAGALPCTWNLSITLASFSTGGVYSGTITIAANFGCIDLSIATGMLTGSVSYLVTASGNVSIITGHLTSTVFRLAMTGTAKTFSTTIGYGLVWLYDFTCSGTISIISGTLNIAHSLTIDSGKTLTLSDPTGGIDYWAYVAGSSFTNSGTISGTGMLVFCLYTSDLTYTFGTINCPVRMTNGLPNANHKFILATNTTFGSSFSILSGHATYTVTLDDGANYTLSIAGTVTVGDRAVMAQGTGAWSFGDYHQIGTSSLLVQGGPISSADLTVSDGTLTGNVNYIWTASDDVSIANGTLTTDTLRLTMTGSSKILDCDIAEGTAWFYDLRFSGNTSTDGVVGVTYNLTIDTGKTVTLLTTGILRLFFYYASSSFSNFGTINGPYTSSVAFNLYHDNYTIIFGTINAPVHMGSLGWAPYNLTFTMGANASLGGNFMIHNDTKPTGDRWVILDAGPSNYGLTITGSVSILDYGMMTQGSGVWSFGSTFTQLGVETIFNQGGPLSIAGNITIGSTGTFNADGHIISYSGSWTLDDGIFSQSFLSASVHLSFHSPEIIGLITLPTYASGIVSLVLDSLDVDANVTFTLSGLESGRMYRLYIDGVSSNLFTASGSGVISFTYSGPWSEHQFEIVATSITGSISPLVNLIFMMFAIGVVVGVIVEGTKPIRNGTMLTSEQQIKTLVNMVIYIIIGIASLGVLYNVVA